MYTVEFLPSAAKAFRGLEPALQRRVARGIDRLAEDPRAGAVKLRGADDIWRIRVGDHRILYAIEEDRLLVMVIKIGHRRDVYR